jgi:hypothetical protein
MPNNPMNIVCPRNNEQDNDPVIKYSNIPIIIRDYATIHLTNDMQISFRAGTMLDAILVRTNSKIIHVGGISGTMSRWYQLPLHLTLFYIRMPSDPGGHLTRSDVIAGISFEQNNQYHEFGSTDRKLPCSIRRYVTLNNNIIHCIARYSQYYMWQKNMLVSTIEATS